jgi:hypothetical protein
VEFYGPAVVIAHNTAQAISGDTQLAYNLNVFDNTGGLMHDTSTLAASKVVNIITDGTYAFSHFAAISCRHPDRKPSRVGQPFDPR